MFTDENKNKKTQQDEADINANASGVAEPFKVSYPPVGIQETSLTSEPEQHQQPTDIAPSNPASIVSTVSPEPKQHQQPSDTVPSNTAFSVSTVTRESKQHQQPTDRVPTNTASNMKRSKSPELMTEPKKTRSTSNRSNDAGSVSYNLSATTTSADTTKTADKTAAATAIVTSDIATRNVIPNELVATDPDSSQGEGHLRDGRNSESNISEVYDSSGNNIADRVKKGRNVISNQAEIEGLSNTNNSNSKTLVGSKATNSTTDPLSRNTPKEVEDTAGSSNAKSFEKKGGQIQSNNEDKKTQTYSSVAAKSTVNKNASQNKVKKRKKLN